MLKIYKYALFPRKFIQLKHSRRFGQMSEPCREPCPPSYICKRPKPDPDIARWLASYTDWVHPFLRCPRNDSKFFRNLSLFVCLPTCICMYFIVYYMMPKQKRPKFIKYEYLRIRNKPFPWNPDSPKTLFHNSYYNALPDGYEYEVPEEEEIDPRPEDCRQGPIPGGSTRGIAEGGGRK